MIIQHNLTAMKSNRYLGINNKRLSKSLEKLSSGYQINRAGENAAGIGTSRGDGCDIYIKGGTVEASGSDYAIGGEGCTGEIDGNAVVRTKGDIDDSIDIKKGVVFEDSKKGNVYGDVTLTDDQNTKAGETLEIGEDASLTVGKGTTFTNDGTINVHGRLVNNGTLINNGTINARRRTYKGCS